MRTIALALLLASIAGCALEVTRQPSKLSEVAASAPPALVTTEVIEVALDGGYRRTIRAGAQFAVVGTIAEGRVLKPVGAVFTIEGAHMHEAYPVVRDTTLVGFYLPAEKAFSPLTRTIPFPTTERNR